MRSTRIGAWRAVQSVLAAAVVVAAGAIKGSAQLPVRSSAPPTPPDLADSPSPEGETLTISLLTVGQGGYVWELFGHNAIWIHDAATQTDSVHDWGVFDMREHNFILHFLQGRMLYSMGNNDLERIARYQQVEQRPVWVQELDLAPAQRAYIRDYIRWNARPENQRYLYDYFLDNCSTRVRDLLDRAVFGAIRAQLTKRVTETTYRSHSLRLMQGQFPTMLGVDVALGRPTDRPLTAWEETFLPGRLQADLRTVTVAGRPLVKSERLLLPADRAPEPTAPPVLWPTFLAVGIVLGLAILALASMQGGLPRIGAAVMIATWSALAGLLGLILLFLWTTNHVAAHRNENLLLFHPLWFAGLPLAARIARRRVRPATAWSVAMFGALPAIALLAHAVRLSHQDNVPLIALVVPVAAAFVLLARVPRPAVSRPGS